MSTLSAMFDPIDKHPATCLTPERVGTPERFGARPCWLRPRLVLVKTSPEKPRTSFRTGYTRDAAGDAADRDVGAPIGVHVASVSALSRRCRRLSSKEAWGW
jgi:hypothetical protein